MKQKYTIDIVLSDAEIYFLRRLFGKNANTGVARLVTIAVKRSVAESARQDLAETGYAPVEARTASMAIELAEIVRREAEEGPAARQK